MTIKYSSSIRERHIAPGASTITKADIPHMRPSHWVGKFFLNSVFTASFAPPMNAYAYNFLRRVQYAFSEHHLARETTLGFLASGGQSVTSYVEAIFHWECFLGQSWHAFKLLATVVRAKVFKPNDGSIEQRLNALCNQMKHVESRIENGQMIPGATVPVWLDNEGLQSVDSNLTYAETGEVLKELAKYANALVNPKTAAALLRSSVVS